MAGGGVERAGRCRRERGNFYGCFEVCLGSTAEVVKRDKGGPKMMEEYINLQWRICINIIVKVGVGCWKPKEHYQSYNVTRVH